MTAPSNKKILQIFLKKKVFCTFSPENGQNAESSTCFFQKNFSWKNEKPAIFFANFFLVDFQLDFQKNFKIFSKKINFFRKNLKIFMKIHWNSTKKKFSAPWRPRSPRTRRWRAKARPWRAKARQRRDVGAPRHANVATLARQVATSSRPCSLRSRKNIFATQKYFFRRDFVATSLQKVGNRCTSFASEACAHCSQLFSAFDGCFPIALPFFSL